MKNFIKTIPARITNFVADTKEKLFAKDKGDATIIVVIGLIVIAIVLLVAYQTSLNSTTTSALSDMESQISSMMSSNP